MWHTVSPPQERLYAMIAVQSVRKEFFSKNAPPVVAVDDVSFTVPTGQTLCLIGTSGSGKTTTMKMINRLIEPTAGTIQVGGENILSLDPIQLRRRIGYVIQRGGLFPHLTVADNVGIMCRLESWPEAKRRKRVDVLLDLVNLPPNEFRGRYPRALSGGQRQRVGVARALALDPDYLLMDEPFGALDPITRRDIHQEFVSLRDRMQKTTIIVTHDMGEAFELADQVALMDGGRMVQLGTEADFRERPANDFVARFLEQQAVR